MKSSIPILLYHHVSPDREITPAGFERQMASLLDQGFKSLSLGTLVEVVEGRAPIPTNGFVVTFDDGYMNNWVHAFPVLSKLKIHATIYLVTSRMGRDGFLSWENARQMAASGLVSFGSHTHSHREWVRRQPYQNLEAELTESKQLIEQELSRPCEHLAWPWGDYEKAWWPLVRRLGYRSAATTRPGANTLGTNPMALQRIKVSRQSPEWLKGRLQWHQTALAAQGYGFFHGWDRRFKSWVQSESPYSHG